ncbi:MAG: alpha/beta hydrolase [Rhizobiaceae bacterium]|nr:alpha/beta hydrolase [Rhizobiaceae bacterium]
MTTDGYIHLALKGKAGKPLVFTFHGTGANENQLLPIVEGVLPGAPVVSPRGDVSENGAARFFRRTAEGVYDMDDLARRTEAMAAFVRAHRDAGRKTVGIGYSNGANILASVVFADPSLFDAAVLMHPLIPFQPKVQGRLDGKRILITAGRYDPICPPHLTARLEAHLRAVGADVIVDWHDGGHEIRPQEIEAAKRALAEFDVSTGGTA